MNKTLDGKSFLIGFMLAVIIALVLGAKAEPGVQEVRVVGFSGSDRLPVSLSDTTLKIELVDVKYGIELPVIVKGN